MLHSGGISHPLSHHITSHHTPPLWGARLPLGMLREVVLGKSIPLPSKCVRGGDTGTGPGGGDTGSGGCAGGERPLLAWGDPGSWGGVAAAEGSMPGRGGLCTVHPFVSAGGGLGGPGTTVHPGGGGCTAGLWFGERGQWHPVGAGW